LGKWLILFLKTPSEVSPELTKTIIEELFHLYSSSIVEVCQKYGIDVDSFHRDLDSQYVREIARTPSHIEPKVAVFGSAALDIYGFLEKLPASEEAVYVEDEGQYPGGMGANVAIALAKLNVPVAFFGKIGNDSAARKLFENFSKNKVDLSSINLVDAPSLQTLILSDHQKHRWLFTIGKPQSTLSLTSLEEIDWQTLDHCEFVYIGEVFVEIASAIAEYANTRKKPVIYRPGIPFLKFGIEKLQKIFTHTKIFILNQPGWKQLIKTSRERIKTPQHILKYGPTYVILTKSTEGCTVFSANRQQEFPLRTHLQSKFDVVDPTGAGDGFSAGLIKGLISGWSLEKAVAYGQTVASIVCARIGSSNTFPTVKEVEHALNQSVS
jgi:ribokinase